MKLLFLLISLFGVFAQAQTTANFDNYGSNSNSSETSLTPTTVVGPKFERLGVYVYVLDTNCMGHLQGSNMSCAFQTFTTSGASPTNISGSYDVSYSTGMNTLFLPLTSGDIFGFSWNGTVFNSTPSVTVSNVSAFPVPMLFTSSNGVSTGIIWTVTVSTESYYQTEPATLSAWNASTGSLIWSDSTIGTNAKFVEPLVVNGYVYVPTNSNGIYIYGLRSSASSMHNGGSITAGGVLRQ